MMMQNEIPIEYGQVLTRRELWIKLKTGAKITTQQLNGFKRMSKVSPTTKSEIDPELTVRELIKQKWSWVQKKMQEGEPILFVSVDQFKKGGAIWNDCPEPLFRYGLLNHLGVNVKGQYKHEHPLFMPTNQTQAELFLNYGAMIEQGVGLRQTILSVTRDEMVNPVCSGEVLTYRIMPAYGYIKAKPTPHYVGESGKSISGWFLDDPDESAYERKKAAILMADDWWKMQWAVSCYKLGMVTDARIKRAVKMIENAEALRRVWMIGEDNQSRVFLSLDPGLDPAIETWRVDNNGVDDEVEQ